VADTVTVRNVMFYVTICSLGFAFLQKKAEVCLVVLAGFNVSSE